ncbi:uncharacterized protein LOC118486525 [Helianthus annuus]|uniref:uncharacterized protein LOC118486525 n=1 Tax=Helianthus annuus TaxID=4232 RepID=UPI001652CB7E|nr:uncharacterized protein LOC118486525 [Helianthus annuus]
MAIVSDDEVPSEREVYTSDTTSTDDDDFQPFALPDVGVEPTDGLPVGDLPLAVIPAPTPLATYPVVDMPLDVVSNDDVDLFKEDPPEADHEGGAPIVADVILPIADAPAEEGEQHHSHDADPDMALSAAPEHDPVHDDAPAVGPFIDDIPIANQPIVAPPLVDDHVVDAPVDAPLLMEDHVVARLPDPVPVLFDRAPFTAHIDPRYADTRNGWIDDDDDYPPFMFPVKPPDIPPPRPGEGSSRQPPVPVPPTLSSPFPFASQFPTVAPPTA